MKIISPNFIANLHTCHNCGALLQYDINDVYDNHIFCPICKTRQECALQADYDGIVWEEVKEEESEVKIING